MATPQRSGMTGEEFLAWEAEQDGKHESPPVDPDSGRLELYRRNPQNQWVLHTPEGDTPLKFTSINLKLHRRTLFEDAMPNVD